MVNLTIEFDYSCVTSDSSLILKEGRKIANSRMGLAAFHEPID
jgi:hypothetical protein